MLRTEFYRQVNKPKDMRNSFMYKISIAAVSDCDSSTVGTQRLAWFHMALSKQSLPLFSMKMYDACLPESSRINVERGTPC